MSIFRKTCPNTHPYCFRVPIGGKKPITKDCEGKPYSSEKALESLFRDGKTVNTSPNQPKNLCGEGDITCSCKQFDLAWLTIINDINKKLDLLKEIITSSDEINVGVIVDSISKQKNPINFRLGKFLKQVVEIWKVRWEIDTTNPNPINQKRGGALSLRRNYTCKNFFEDLITISECRIVKTIDAQMGQAKNFSEEEIIKVLKPQGDIRKTINELKSLFKIMLHLGNDKSLICGSDPTLDNIKTEMDLIKKSFGIKKEMNGGRRKTKKRRKQKTKKRIKRKRTHKKNMKGGLGLGIVFGIVVIIIVAVGGGIDLLVDSWGNKQKNKEEKVQTI